MAEKKTTKKAKPAKAPVKKKAAPAKKAAPKKPRATANVATQAERIIGG